MWVPKTWMVYNGRSYWNGWSGYYQHFRKPPIYIYIHIYIYIYIYCIYCMCVCVCICIYIYTYRDYQGCRCHRCRYWRPTFWDGFVQKWIGYIQFFGSNSVAENEDQPWYPLACHWFHMCEDSDQTFKQLWMWYITLGVSWNGGTPSSHPC